MLMFWKKSGGTPFRRSLSAVARVTANDPHFHGQINKSNSTVSAVQVEASLQEELSVRLQFRN